jgi:hypothetical protein
MKKKPMSRFIKSTHGIMGLSLSQIGLFLATGILLTAVLSFLFFNNWQRPDELRSCSCSFSTLLEDMDALFFEHTTHYQFPTKPYPYSIYLSSEYIIAMTTGPLGNNLCVTERFLVRPWIRFSLQNWTTGDELHEYLNTSYGHFGTVDDTISFNNVTQLRQEQNASLSFYALHPLELLLSHPVMIENVIIYYDAGQAYKILLVYQIR